MRERTKRICTFCPMNDTFFIRKGAISAHFSANELISTEYDPDGRGLCARGNLITELIRSHERVRFPILNSEEVSWERAKKTLQKTLSSSKRIGIITDGSITLEQAYILGELAESTGAKLSLSDTSDWLAGMFARTRGTHLEDIEKTSFLLVVGDILSEHPTIGRHILKSRYGSRGADICVVDSVPSRTRRFSRTGNIHLKPGREAEFITMLAKLAGAEEYNSIDISLLAERCGVTPDVAECILARFKDTEGSILIISHTEGHTENIPLLYEAGYKLTERLNKGFLPFTTYSNSLGVVRVIKDLVPISEMISSIEQGKIDTLICINCCAFCQLPAATTVLDKLASRILISPIRPAKNDNYNLVLPAGFIFESNGSYLTISGDILPFPDEFAPVSGIPTLDSLLLDISKLTGKEISIPDAEKIKETLDSFKPMEKAELSTESKRPDTLLTAVATAFPTHLGAGFLTRRTAYNKNYFPVPWIEINEQKADELDVKDGETALVTSDYGTACFTIKTVSDMPKDVVSIPAHYRETAMIFGRGLNKSVGPVPVSIRKE